MPSKKALDELYREHPSGFVAGRNRLAKEAADPDEAKRIRALKRPSAAAWLLNAAALRDRAALRRFAQASAALEKAQNRALEGARGGAERFRAAIEREREAAGAVLESAERLAQEAGHPPTQSALRAADDTLRAAAAHPDLRQRVVSGRLEREQSGVALGALPGSGVRKQPGKTGASAKKRAAAQAKREAKRLERELADAEARVKRQQDRVDEAVAALKRERAELAERKRDAAAARRRIKAAR